jgi:hypothetical protein
MNKLSFSGHESFYCKYFWLKKGYDFIQNEHNFNRPDAVVQLGVGKNMVSAIRFWLKAFGLVTADEQPTELAKIIFDGDGKQGGDPYLNDTGSLWLLHYLLVTQERASIYAIIFNNFRKLNKEFTRSHLDKFIQMKCADENLVYTKKTIDTDISVFIRNYYRSTEGTKNPEEEYSGLLLDLNLLKKVERDGLKEVFTLENNTANVPLPILLYAILDGMTAESTTITFTDLLTKSNKVGSVFMLDAEVLDKALRSLEQQYSGQVAFSSDAFTGNKTLQIKGEISKNQLLIDYYNGYNKQ